MPRATERTTVSEIAPGLNGDIFVVRRGTQRAMRFSGIDAVDQSVVDLARPERPVPAYLRAAALGLRLARQQQRALLIGLGGGGFLRLLRRRYPRLPVDVVEVDPRVTELARRHFRFREGKFVTLHQTDAILHLSVTEERYDFILLDAYDGPSLSPRLGSTDFFRLAHGALADHGVCVANVSLRSRRAGKRVMKNFSRSFGSGSFEIPMQADWNRVLFGSAAAFPPESEIRKLARNLDRQKHFAFPLWPFLRHYRLLD